MSREPGVVSRDSGKVGGVSLRAAPQFYPVTIAYLLS